MAAVLSYHIKEKEVLLVLSFPEPDYIKIVILNVKLVVVTPLFFRIWEAGSASIEYESSFIPLVQMLSLGFGAS